MMAIIATHLFLGNFVVSRFWLLNHAAMRIEEQMSLLHSVFGPLRYITKSKVLSFWAIQWSSYLVLEVTVLLLILPYTFLNLI